MFSRLLEYKMESPCFKERELCGQSCPVGGTWYSVIGDAKEKLDHSFPSSATTWNIKSTELSLVLEKWCLFINIKQAKIWVLPGSSSTKKSLCFEWFLRYLQINDINKGYTKPMKPLTYFISLLQTHCITSQSFNASIVCRGLYGYLLVWNASHEIIYIL